MNWIDRENSRWLLVILLAVTLVQACAHATPAPAQNQAGRNQSLAVFRGAWFEVRYPGDFTARPSLASRTAEGYDSAEFTSPDGSVAFYVFAPQWGGEAADILLQPEQERLLAERSQQEADRTLRWFTIEATNGSYRRSYQETLAQQGAVKTIVGIKYRDEESRRRYIEAYHRFRQSLEQYAD